MKLQFLGYGNANALSLGNSSAVIEIERTGKNLVIDYGHTSHQAFKSKYQRIPDAIYITHCHLDHIAGLESLFYEAIFQPGLVKLFVPSALIPILHQRLASLESMLAEGSTNFWDAFQLIPVTESFWYENLKFSVFESRHHMPKFCFGLALPGHFLYTGDTKPIPEVINRHANSGEIIFHDLSLKPQPSHTYLEELSDYTEEQRSRMWFYHIQDENSAATLKQFGLRCVDNQIIFSWHENKDPHRTAEISMIQPAKDKLHQV